MADLFDKVRQAIQPDKFQGAKASAATESRPTVTSKRTGQKYLKPRNSAEKADIVRQDEEYEAKQGLSTGVGKSGTGKGARTIDYARAKADEGSRAVSEAVHGNPIVKGLEDTVGEALSGRYPRGKETGEKPHFVPIGPQSDPNDDPMNPVNFLVNQAVGGYNAVRYQFPSEGAIAMAKDSTPLERAGAVANMGRITLETAAAVIPAISKTMEIGEKGVRSLLRAAKAGDMAAFQKIERALAKLPEYQRSPNVVETPQPKTLAEIVARHEPEPMTTGQYVDDYIQGKANTAAHEQFYSNNTDEVERAFRSLRNAEEPKTTATVEMPPPVSLPEGLGGPGLKQGPEPPQTLAEIVSRHEAPHEVDPALQYETLLEDVDPIWTRAELEQWAAEKDVPIYRAEQRWADLQDETVDLDPIASYIDADDVGRTSSEYPRGFRGLVQQLRDETDGGAGREALNRMAPIIRAIDKSNLQDARKIDLFNWLGKNEIEDVDVARRLIAEAEANPKFRFDDSEVNEFGRDMVTPSRRLESMTGDRGPVSGQQFDRALDSASGHSANEPGHYYDQPRPKPVEPKPARASEDLRNTSHADTDEVRDILGLPERDVNPETIAEWLDGARKHRGHELAIARNILDEPRVITKTEGIALGRRLNELVRKMGEARVAGDLDSYDLLRSEANEIADGLDAGGSEWGRSGRARQQLLAEDYSDFGIKRRAEKAAGEKPVPAAVTKELDDLRVKLEETEAKLAEHQARAATAEVAKRTKRFRPSEVVAKDIEAAWNELRQAASKASANPFVDPEIWAAFGKLVKLEVERGASTLEDLVGRLLDHATRAGIQATESDVRRAIAGMDKPESVPKSVKAGVQKLRNLKREAELIERIESIDSAAAKSPKHKRAKAKRIEELENELAELQARRRDADRLEVKRVNAEQRVILNERVAWEKQRAKDATRKTPEQLKAERSESYKRDLEAQIGDLQDQIQTGELKQKVAKKRQYDNETENLLYEREKLQREVDRKIEHLQLTTGQKVWRSAVQVGENIRGTILGSDFGIVLRQGLFSLSRPRAYGKGVRAAMRAGLSDARLAAIERELDMREVNGMLARRLEKESGLQRTTSHRTLNEQEELVLARLVKKLPEWAAAGLDRLGAKGAAELTRKVGDATAGSLLRGQHAFINTVRAETFDQAVRAGFDARELQLRAQFINNATGRSNAKQVPQIMSTIFTSPRYERSRWAMLGELPKNVAIGTVDLVTGKGINRAALANLQDMGVTAASVFTTFKIAELAGYEVDWNPTSADFLKMRRGDEVWDVSAGIAPRLRDLCRLVFSFNHPGPGGKNVASVAGGSFVRAASPALKTPVEAISAKFQENQDLEKIYSYFSGWETDEERSGLITFLPLIVQSFEQNLAAEGPGAAVGAGVKEFVGTSVNRYPKKEQWDGSDKPAPKRQGTKRRKRLIPPD